MSRLKSLVVLLGLVLAVAGSVNAGAKAGHHTSWMKFCRSHAACSQAHPWIWRSDPRVRWERWRAWCDRHERCLRRHALVAVRYTVAGPTGERILGTPEGAWISTFVEDARTYGDSPEILMAIGIVESGGGYGTSVYMGCENPSTFGSWPAQIGCAARALALDGLAGYNSSNPAYASIVEGQAAGIDLVRSS